MTEPSLDGDALIAAVDVIGRTGATGYECGYLNEDTDIPAEADWYAQVRYGGTRVIEEHHVGPVEATEALARRLLEGGVCQHCGGLVALTDAGAMIHPGARMLDGTVMTVERAQSMPQCHWTRQGARWVRGCEGRPARPVGPSRQERRAAERARRKR